MNTEPNPPERSPGTALRIAILGAGVVGQVYADRLARSGQDVWLLARGGTLETLQENGIHALLRGRKGAALPSPPPSAVHVVGSPAEIPGVDLAILAVRADQVESALPTLDQVDAALVLTLVNLGGDARDVTERIGQERTVLGFPGVGGHRGPHEVSYHEVRQQPTMIGRAGGREQAVTSVLRGAGFTVDVVDDAPSWLVTHTVFIAGIGAAILEAGSSESLGRDRRRTGQMIRSVADGFHALTARGIVVTPAPLRTIFTRMPRLISVPYWQHQLTGDLGRLALAPHVIQTRASEFPKLVAQARSLTGNPELLDRALIRAGFPAHLREGGPA